MLPLVIAVSATVGYAAGYMTKAYMDYSAIPEEAKVLGKIDKYIGKRLSKMGTEELAAKVVKKFKLTGEELSALLGMTISEYIVHTSEQTPEGVTRESIYQATMDMMIADEEDIASSLVMRFNLPIIEIEEIIGCHFDNFISEVKEVYEMESQMTKNAARTASNPAS